MAEQDATGQDRPIECFVPVLACARAAPFLLPADPPPAAEGDEQARRKRKEKEKRHADPADASTEGGHSLTRARRCGAGRGTQHCKTTLGHPSFWGWRRSPRNPHAKERRQAIPSNSGRHGPGNPSPCFCGGAGDFPIAGGGRGWTDSFVALLGLLPRSLCSLSVRRALRGLLARPAQECGLMGLLWHICIKVSWQRYCCGTDVPGGTFHPPGSPTW
eukprot:gene4332-biopygen5408